MSLLLNQCTQQLTFKFQYRTRVTSLDWTMIETTIWSLSLVLEKIMPGRLVMNAYRSCWRHGPNGSIRSQGRCRIPPNIRSTGWCIQGPRPSGVRSWKLKRILEIFEWKSNMVFNRQSHSRLGQSIFCPICSMTILQMKWIHGYYIG